jgi:riboflavin kinase/FMN adenylyltransferase
MIRYPQIYFRTLKEQEFGPFLINRMLILSIGVFSHPIMRVHTDIDNLPRFKNAVLTIGTFDGVHTGHRAILEQLIEEAVRYSGETVVITFDPHPRRILNRDQAPGLLTSMEERIEQFEKIGIDHLVIIPFDQAFAEMSAEEYVEKFLVQRFHPKVLVIGYDHRFGKGRTGDYTMLANLGILHHYEVRQIPQKLLNDAQISSTTIRQALLAGEITQANKLLNYRYQIEGIVIEGDKLGRELGFPTANLSLTTADKLIPASGVYAVIAQLKEEGQVRNLKGMMNIGIRPTVNGKEKRIEVHLFEFDEIIYQKILRVCLIEFVRDEIKFSGLDALVNQLNEDKKNISKLMEKITHS